MENEVQDWSEDFGGEVKQPAIAQDWSSDFVDRKAKKKPKTFMENIDDSVQKVGTAKGYIENVAQGVQAVSGLRMAAIKGSIKGGSELLALPFDLLGGIALGGEEIGKELKKGLTPPADRGIQLTDYTKQRLKEEGKDVPKEYESPNANPLSKGYFATASAIKHVGDKLTDLSIDNYQPETIPERIVERGSNYAVQGAAFTQGLVSVGKEVIKSNVKNPSLLQKMTTEMAKDPAKAHKIEQAMGMIAATAGQTAEEAGASPGYQFLAEVVGTVTAGTVVNAFKKFASSNFISRWMNKKEHAEADVGEFFDAIFSEQPTVASDLKEGQRLSKEYGVKMDVGELMENPELQASYYALGGGTTGGQTALREKAKGQAKAVNEMFAKPAGDLQTSQQALVKSSDEEIIRLKNSVISANERSIDEALNVGNLKGVEVEDVGQAILYRLDEAEDLATRELTPLYKGIDLTQKTGSKYITDSISDARRTLLPKNEFKGELESHLKSILNAVTGRDAKPKTYGTKKPFTLQGDKKGFDFTVGSIQEMQGQLKRVIREERSKGNNELVRSLSKILGSTYDQLDNVSGQNVDRLKSANAKAREVFERFNDTRIKTITRVDMQGDMKVAPEDIVSTLVKSNNQKGSMESVDAFYDAIKDRTLAKEQLFNAFSLKLRNEATISKTIKMADGSEQTIKVLDHKKVQSIIDKHSNFLRAAKINIKDPAVMAKKAAFAQETLDMTITEMSRDSLMKFAKTDTPVKYVMSALENNTLPGLMKRADELTKRGIREALWDGLFESSFTTQSLGGGEAAVSVNKIKSIMRKRGKSLEEALGSKHYKNIKDIVSIVDRISMSEGKAGKIAAQGIDQHLVEKMMTGLRAAAHGFVRPDLIIAQATMRASKAMNTMEAQKLLMEALENPDMAFELAKAAKDIRTRGVVYTMFTPLLSSSINFKQTDTEE